MMCSAPSINKKQIYSGEFYRYIGNLNKLVDTIHLYFDSTKNANFITSELLIIETPSKNAYEFDYVAIFDYMLYKDTIKIYRESRNKFIIQMGQNIHVNNLIVIELTKLLHIPFENFIHINNIKRKTDQRNSNIHNNPYEKIVTSIQLKYFGSQLSHQDTLLAMKEADKSLMISLKRMHTNNIDYAEITKSMYVIKKILLSKTISIGIEETTLKFIRGFYNSLLNVKDNKTEYQIICLYINILLEYYAPV